MNRVTQPSRPLARLAALLAAAGFATTALAAAPATAPASASPKVSPKATPKAASAAKPAPSTLGENDVDPAAWGPSWPLQYQGYKQTAEKTQTRYGGWSGGAEGAVPLQKAERDPWLTRIFAGYLFAVDFRDRRGHAYALQDQENTRRNLPAEGKQSGNCLHCHASIMPLYRALGKEALPKAPEAEQLQAGLAKVGEMGYWDAHKMLSGITGKIHPVSCVDCHDPKSMELRVTRPGFITGMQKLAASSAAVPHLPSVEAWRKGSRAVAYDPNRDASKQEKRSLACGQCHVEYFCGKGTTIFFPWGEGLKMEQMEHLYDGLQVQGKRFKDWTHAETGMELLKAQHPEFEMWSQGIHARSGVGCADCHMPTKKVDGKEFSDHWVRSPLLQPSVACGSCHSYDDQEIRARVEQIQDRHFALMSRAGVAAVAMIDAIVAVRKPFDERHRAAAAAKARATLEKQEPYRKASAEEQGKRLAAETKGNLLTMWREVVEKTPAIKELGELQRAAQWRLDLVAAENSMGFHAPQEMARILAESIDLSRQAELKAAKLAGGALAAAGPAKP